MLRRFSAKSECTCKAFIYSELSGESFAECIDFLFRALKEPIFLLIFKKYHRNKGKGKISTSEKMWTKVICLNTSWPSNFFFELTVGENS